MNQNYRVMTKLSIESFMSIYEEWKASGLSVQQYCENIGMRENRFYYWKAKLKNETQSSSTGSFIPVKMNNRIGITSKSQSNPLCEVIYPNGVTVRVTTDMTLDQLRQMITLIK